MLTFAVRTWAAWASGIDGLEAWQRWCATPSPLAEGGRPNADFLPPLFRRRCSPLTRLMLHVAYAACGHDAVATVPTVFASRYGELALTLSLLEILARREPVTASAFTHSVHNTQAGLFSIAAQNREMATAVSAGPDTFPCAVLEALALIERAGGGPALLVMAEEPVPSTFALFDDDEPPVSYALALVIERAGEGQLIELAPTDGGVPAFRPRWPRPIEFLRWLLSREPALALGDSSSWICRRR